MKVLLAIDGSPGSEAALRELAYHGWSPGSQVRVVTVDAPLNWSTFGGPARTAYDELIRSQRDAATARLNDALALLRALAPDLSAHAALLEGSPRDEIIAEARRWGAELVVVGSRGHGAIKSVLLGSVSMAVVLQAPCSVWVVRKPDA